MSNITVCGADFGASLVKMSTGLYDGSKIRLTNNIVFDNKAVETPNALYWDIFGLYSSVIDGLSRYRSLGIKPISVGIDAWGASYGLLDSNNNLLEPVFHYRDKRTALSIEQMHKMISAEEIFKMTGCQCNRTYTLPQLYSYIEHDSKMLEYAKKLLFLPDLVEYFLSGEISTEMTIAGTSSIMNTNQEDWSKEILNKLGIPNHFLTGIVDAGTVKGTLLKNVREKTGMADSKVIAVVGHDSASAVAAIPGFSSSKLYISIGTNISMGVETDQSIVTHEAFTAGFKNTGGFGRKKIVYRDFPAFWLINELAKALANEGRSYSYAEYIEIARKSKIKQRVFDIEEAKFGNADGDIRIKINDSLKERGQDKLGNDGDFVLCILESITAKIQQYAFMIKDVLKIPYDEACIVNGGCQNTLLMQMIADALQIEVKAGMPQATLVGNLLTQLYAIGEISGVQEMRQIAADSFEMKAYYPRRA